MDANQSQIPWLETPKRWVGVDPEPTDQTNNKITTLEDAQASDVKILRLENETLISDLTFEEQQDWISSNHGQDILPTGNQMNQTNLYPDYFANQTYDNEAEEKATLDHCQRQLKKDLKLDHMKRLNRNSKKPSEKIREPSAIFFEQSRAPETRIFIQRKNTK